jgi:hypothetical protein
LRVLNVSAIVRLAKAALEPRARDEAKVMIEKRHHRNQGPRGLAIGRETHRFKSRMKMLSQLARINPVTDDYEVLERRFDGQSTRDWFCQKARCVPEIFDQGHGRMVSLCILKVWLIRIRPKKLRTEYRTAFLYTASLSPGYFRWDVI